MDSVVKKQENLLTVRSMAPRLLKALAKAALAGFCFIVISAIAAPIQSSHGFQPVFTAFSAVYLLFIFVIEITRGTIYQHVFSMARSLAVLVYFAYLLTASVVSFPVEQVSLSVNLQFFFYVLLLGGVLGLVKSMLQLLNWINEKEEYELSLQVKSL